MTFDLEEFNLPLEYGRNIRDNEMFLISYKGCSKILRILNEYDIKSTFFTTLNFGQKFPGLINKIVNKGHEIALHYFFDFSEDNMNQISEQKMRLEDISGMKIVGFRGHQLKLPPFKLLNRMGFKYDSSVHPTFIPMRYNYLSYPTEEYRIDGLLEIPISVTPLVRLPFSFLWFRNFGVTYVKLCTLVSTVNRKFLNLYFHPWEFADISKYRIPFYIKRNCGKKMIKKFKKYVKWCSTNNFQFKTIYDFTKNLY